MKIDARSDKVALHYTGSEAGEPAISGVPARDLSENDIDRIVRIRHGGEPLAGAARQGAIDKIVDELTDGPYRVTAPTSTKKAAAPAKAAPAVEPTAAEPSADEPKEDQP